MWGKERRIERGANTKVRNLHVGKNPGEKINLPKKFKNAIDGDRAKNCLYDNYYFKKKIGFFREKIHIQNGLKSSIRYFIKNYKNFKLNNKTLKLFNKFNHY